MAWWITAGEELHAGTYHRISAHRTSPKPATPIELPFSNLLFLFNLSFSQSQMADLCVYSTTSTDFLQDLFSSSSWLSRMCSPEIRLKTVKKKDSKIDVFRAKAVRSTSISWHYSRECVKKTQKTLLIFQEHKLKPKNLIGVPNKYISDILFGTLPNGFVPIITTIFHNVETQKKKTFDQFALTVWSFHGPGFFLLSSSFNISSIFSSGDWADHRRYVNDHVFEQCFWLIGLINSEYLCSVILYWHFNRLMM